MVTVQTAKITFTVCSQNDLTCFVLCINLQGQNLIYSNNYTCIACRNGGAMQVTDRHRYILNATATTVQRDEEWPEEKMVITTLEFAETASPTNREAYMWDAERRAVQIRTIDILDVVAMSEPIPSPAAAPEPANDVQLIELLSLENYLGTDIPDWMMTEMTALVANGDIAVDQFVLRLQYVFEGT